MSDPNVLPDFDFEKASQGIRENSDTYYEGTMDGLKKYGLPALRKAAMMGLTLKDDAVKIQRMLREAILQDLQDQCFGGSDPRPAA